MIRVHDDLVEKEVFYEKYDLNAKLNSKWFKTFINNLIKLIIQMSV